MNPQITEALIKPNWHVAAVHIPLGLLLIGSLIELLSPLWRRGRIRQAGQMMLLIGAMAAVPAAFSGLHALMSVASAPDGRSGLPWHEVISSTQLTPAAWDLLVRHFQLSAVATGAFLLAVLWHLSCSDSARRKLYPLHWLLMVGGLVALMAGAWHGGEAVYQHRVAVAEAPPAAPVVQATESPLLTEAERTFGHPNAGNNSAGSTVVPLPKTEPVAASNLELQDPLPQIAGSDSPTSPPSTSPSTAPTTAPSTQPTLIDQLTEQATELLGPAATRSWWYAQSLRIFPPMETHVYAAGWAASFSCLALAMMLRNASAYHDTARSVDPRRSALSIARPNAQPPVVPMLAPAKRTWLVAMLTSSAAALAGWWYLAHTSGTYAPQDLWLFVAAPIDDPEMRRRFAHVMVGSFIIGAPLVGLLLAWLAPRRRFTTWLLGLLLVSALAAQVWLGVLMTFDSVRGPLLSFNAPSVLSISPVELERPLIGPPMEETEKDTTPESNRP